MFLTRIALKNPAAVAVMVAVVFLAGIAAITRLPVQLFPDTTRPTLAVQTSWRSASPLEIESEIVEPQEQALSGLSGLTEMQVWANQGGSWINLTFRIGTNMEAATLDVLGRLNQLPPLPADANGPNLVLAGNNANSTLSYFFIQTLPGNSAPPESFMRWVEDTVIPRIESVDGVARAEIQWGGRAEELHITVDPFRAAELGVPLPAIAAALRGNQDTSGGVIEVGRRQYTLRFEGKYDPEQLENLVLDWRGGTPVRLGDVADIEVGFDDVSAFAIQNGNPALGMRVMRENGANLLATLTRVKAEIAAINAGPGAAQQLYIAQSFDASVFIKRAIRLLTNNLIIGVGLAILGLWLFLRRARALAIISFTIPVCLLSTFIVLELMGRTLNVISLAGLAFATGMVLDAAIVVLENIVRRREAGEDPERAAIEGSGQVWGALLASTITTVAIFLPIVFLEDVEGQLFADLAITIAVGVGVSLVVAVTVLPVATVWFMKRAGEGDTRHRLLDRLADALMSLTNAPVRRLAIIVGSIGGAALLTWTLLPHLDYLPPVKRDAVDAWIGLPPGTNIEVVREEVVDVVVERLAPYMSGEKEPALLNYYVGGFPGGASLGVRALDQGRVDELLDIVRDEILADFPDVQAFAQQGDLFGGFGQSGGIQINLQAADQEQLGRAAELGEELLREAFPGVNVGSNPAPGATQPQLTMYPDDRRIQEAGFSRSDMATMVRTLGDGMWVGEHFDGVKRLDVIMRSLPWATPDELEGVPIATRNGGVAPLGEFIRVERSVGPASIQRIDRRRTISLNLNQPPNMSLEEALTKIEAEIEPQIREALGSAGSITYGGAADSLKRAVRTMGQNFAIALTMLFLILAGLFRSLRDAALVVITIPLATVGGVLAIRVLNDVFNVFQPLDLLTMMGFIILLGLVINNAILLVDQTRAGERRGLSRREAVDESLRMRLRPIFMSTLTSILGMTPLLMFPGAGSAIYRGLAASIVGGMSVSLLFTLILLPSLLRLGEGASQRVPAAVPAE